MTPLQHFQKKARVLLAKRSRAKVTAWNMQIDDLEAGGMKRPEAIVAASEHFPELQPLLNAMREQEEAVKETAAVEDATGVKIGRKKQPYIENVRWAVAAAGKFKLYNTKPTKCPNYTAWYLFEQAIADPSKFTALLNQSENKQKEEKDEQKESIIKESERSIKQIDRLLAEITTMP
jgi:hypothetical protein